MPHVESFATFDEMRATESQKRPNEKAGGLNSGTAFFVPRLTLREVGLAD